MADLLIRFRRPGTMSADETQGWLARRARSLRPGTALAREDADSDASVRVSLVPSARTSIEDRLLRYLMSD